VLTDWIHVEGTTPVNDGAWHHAVATYDGSSDANGINIYIDAVPEVLTIVSNNLVGTSLVATDLLVGKRSDDLGFVDGKMDEPAIYTKELSQAEVTEIYNKGAPNGLRALESGANLLAWLQFTQNDIDNFPTIADHSGNGNDGTATNMVTADIQGDIPR